MPRYMRNTVILAKLETVYGTDPTPTGAADALLVSNVSVEPKHNNADRALVLPYMGAPGQLVGTRSVEIAFEAEMAGSGTAGTAPAWGKLLQGCGFAGVVTTGQRVDFSLVSGGFESLTIYYYLDGVLYKALGCRGTMEIKAGAGGRPVFAFRFTGKDGGVTATANATPTLTAWKAPIAVTDTNTGDITLGCTYSAGALSGGTTYLSRGVDLNLGNKVEFVPLLGRESAEISDREGSGKITIELSAAQEVTQIGNINANTLQSLGIVHGTTAGHKVLLYAPAVQMTNPKIEDVQGLAMFSADLRLLPSAGNDELLIVAL